MNYRLFKPLVMFFSMTNSLATFQTIMNNIFWDLITKSIIIIYLDNILIFTQILKEYHKIVYRVLEVLAEHKLFLHSEKCEFDKLYIEYLDLVILENQVEIDSMKVTRVHNQPILTTYIDLQVFLRFTHFYSRFIYSFSEIAYSLFNVTISTST